MNKFQLDVLNALSLSKSDYDALTRAPLLTNLPHPETYFNFSPFIARIEEAIEKEEKILIYGDYDADGILATTILKIAFAKRNYEVFTMIPSRYKDGYGLNVEVVKRIKKRNIDLIITVDNGISAFDAINYAQECGIDVLVSDHHEIGEKLPNTTVIHPDLRENNTINSCGAYMALLISYGLLKKYDEYLVSLAAIATIADMMPLTLHNRELVRLALNFMNEANYPALSLLNKGDFYSVKSIGMGIAPRINALGRLSQNYEANILIEYFSTSDTYRLQTINKYINEVYEERKNLSNGAPLTEEEVKDPAIVTISDALEGVLGLLAQNYVKTYHKPAVVFTKSSEDDTLLKGSARSSSGFSITNAFRELDDLILKSGGHEEAGGLTIKKENFLKFRDEFNKLAALNPFTEREEKVIPISYEDLTPENFAFIESLSPFGFAFPEPIFTIIDAKALNLAFSRDNKHIITTLAPNLKLIGFNIDKNLLQASAYTFQGVFSKSEYKGRYTNDFIITAIKANPS